MAVMEASSGATDGELRKVGHHHRQAQWFNVRRADINTRIKGNIDYGDGATSPAPTS